MLKVFADMPNSLNPMPRILLGLTHSICIEGSRTCKFPPSCCTLALAQSSVNSFEVSSDYPQDLAPSSCLPIWLFDKVGRFCPMSMRNKRFLNQKEIFKYLFVIQFNLFWNNSWQHNFCHLKTLSKIVVPYCTSITLASAILSKNVKIENIGIAMKSRKTFLYMLCLFLRNTGLSFLAPIGC